MLQATLNVVLGAAEQGDKKPTALNAHRSHGSLNALADKDMLLPPKEHTTHQATSRRSFTRKTTSVCANETPRPSAQRNSLTKPSTGAVTATSIFIDSMSTSVSPALTLWPCGERMRQTLPDTGLATATQSAGNSSSRGASGSLGRSAIEPRCSDACQRRRSASNADCWRALCVAMLSRLSARN